MRNAATRHHRSHVRLLVAALIGAVAGVFAPGTLATQALIGWDVAAAVWLLGAAYTIATTSPAEVKKIASQEDEAASLILIILVAAVIASLAGVIVEIGAAANSGQGSLFTLLGVTTIVLSWLFMHTVFAFHYAHRFCGGRGRGDTASAGIAFPAQGDGDVATPGYFDFVYVAFCIGMTCQVSDVDVLTRPFRRIVTAHAVLSFFYNMFILGLAVNLFAGLRAH